MQTPGEERIITLFDAEGKALHFKQVAMVQLSSGSYAVLAPSDSGSGLLKNQALVFAVTPGEDGNARLNIVTDQPLIEAVFGQYCADAQCEIEQRAKNNMQMPL